MAELQAADLVIADLSTDDATVLVQLGIRFALTQRGTLLIAEDLNRLPFNLQASRVVTYGRLGDDLSGDEARHLQSALIQSLLDYWKQWTIDSPVHALLPRLMEAPRQQFEQARDELASTVDRERPWCLVVQGFGQKTDRPTNRVLDLDATYRVIRGVVQAAGLRCTRADEWTHSGVIDAIQMHALLSADLVVADLSTANADTLLELGIRWGLRPTGTLVVAEQDWRSPFDALGVEIVRFQHLGKEIGRREAERFGRVLGERLRARLASPDIDSPVYRMLDHTLWPPFAAHAPAPRPVAPPPEARRFEFDLLISYAHTDDGPVGNEPQGWVSALEQALDAALARMLGRPPRIWRDRALLAGSDWQRPSRDVAVLLCVVSPAYLRSEWCQRELMDFVQTAESQGGLHVDGRSRALWLSLDPVDTSALPAPLQEIQGATFFEERPSGPAERLSPTGPERLRIEYTIRVDDLAGRIADVIGRLGDP
jgi:hypothetical protein